MAAAGAAARRAARAAQGREVQVEDYCSLWNLIWTYWVYIIYQFWGYVREFIELYVLRRQMVPTPEGYAPLFRRFDYFYTRWCFGRISDCWDRPVSSCPGTWMTVHERDALLADQFLQPAVMTDEKRRCLNLGSYNYLGFAETEGPAIEETKESIRRFGVSTCSTPLDAGYTTVHRDLEQLVAEFVGKPAAICFSVGYSTNSTSIPGLVGRGGLIISDELNHASLVSGCRTSGAKIRVFRHNDVADLERTVRQAIVEGQPRTHLPWTKILVVVEGVYSMEGELGRLGEMVELRKRLRREIAGGPTATDEEVAAVPRPFYLFVDEAHSIGATGRTGRGIVEHCGLDPSEVDVLMGTFTKSFAAIGGYMAGPTELIHSLRHSSFSQAYDTSMSVGCAQMALSVMRIIMGQDGTNDGAERLRKLHRNVDFLRDELRKRGFLVLGDAGSAVVPVMTYNATKMAAFSYEMLRNHNVATVVVGFPATSLTTCRVRFCVSAGHRKRDLREAVEAMDRAGERCMIKYCL